MGTALKPVLDGDPPSPRPVRVFVDSGAFSFSRASFKRTGRRWKGNDWSYTQTPEYEEYREAYIAFLLKYREQISVYVNLDVIGSPEQTYANQKRLEERGLLPLPVWHLSSDVSWLRRYLDEGYHYVAIGGMVPFALNQRLLRARLDEIWGEVLTKPDGSPKVKVHGFGMTSYRLMARYPWFSVDSISWVLWASYGMVLVPRWRDGQWRWGEEPWVLGFSAASGCLGVKGKHVETLPPSGRALMLRYLKEIGLPYGETKFVEERKLNDDQRGKKGRKFEKRAGKMEVITPGVSNNTDMRSRANILFYTRFCETLKWPRSFQRTGQKGLLPCGSF